MKRLTSSLYRSLLILLAIVAIQACQKDFDAPPPPADPTIPVTHTVRQLKAMHATSGAIDVINADMVIAGIVTANDKSGNLYKELYLQDTSGAIAVQLDVAGLHNSYPVGRRVFIKCKGLALSDYNRLTQLGIKATISGLPSLQAVPSNLITQYVIGGSINNPVTPQVVNVNQLGTTMNDDFVGRLIQLKNYEFAPADTSKTYADTSAFRNSQNLTARNCQAGSSIIIRTSGYAQFAPLNVPNGNGDLTAIYTIFGSTKQLLIRDTSDVQFKNPRCGQGATTPINTSELRALFRGTTLSAPDGRRITGVVISDRTTASTNAQNIVLQQGNGLAGIVVRFESAHPFNLGDSLDVNVSQQELSEFNGLLQVTNVPLSYATLRASGKSITPRVVTLTELNTNFENWESTLVKIGPASLSGGTAGKYAGNVTVNDGVTITLFTPAGASFANNTFPATVLSVTGFVGQFGSARQISLRQPDAPLNDIVAAGPAASNALKLQNSPFLENFNDLATGLPKGVFAKIGATATSIGTGDMPVYGTGLSVPTAWNQSSAGLKNFASATGLTATADATAQNASTNRALGIRQTSSTGYDPGTSFAFMLANTIGKSGLKMSVLLQSLDASIGRTTVWKVQYGIGDNPTSFTDVTTMPATTNTTNNFGSVEVTADFGSSLNNIGQPIWIRIITLSATTGTGSRASTAIDDLKFNWN